jgi:hypothetical protein
MGKRKRLERQERDREMRSMLLVVREKLREALVLSRRRDGWR